MSYESKLNKFKENYINEKSNKMALDQAYIKIISLEITTLYAQLFNVFLRKNKNKVDFLLNEAKKDLVIAENKYYFKQLSFFIAIPKIIKFNKADNDFYIDYDFLKNNFYKTNDKELINDWNRKLSELEEEFKKENNNSSINVKDLYIFGTFILDFLTDFEFRKNIMYKIVEVNVNSKIDEFVDVINPQFIQNKGNNSNWSRAKL